MLIVASGVSSVLFFSTIGFFIAGSTGTAGLLFGAWILSWVVESAIKTVAA